MTRLKYGELRAIEQQSGSEMRDFPAAHAEKETGKTSSGKMCGRLLVLLGVTGQEARVSWYTGTEAVHTNMASLLRAGALNLFVLKRYLQMSDLRFSIEIPVPGLGQYYLCHCETPEQAAEVVRSLLSAKVPTYDRVTVVIRPKEGPISGQEKAPW